MDVRRVVTGHDASGKAVFVSDEQVPPVTLALLPGHEWHQLWGGDAASTFPDDGSRPDAPSYFPAAGGFRFVFFTLPPDGGVPVPEDLDIDAALAELAAELPGMAEHFDLDDPGMHTTATVDFGVVLSGTAILELADGATQVLNPGDTYVQNGTRHRWSNPGDVPAVLAVAIVGAHHDAVG